MTLAQNATANVNVQVQVPTAALTDTLDNFSFTAQSTTDPTLSNTLKVGPLRVGELPQLKLGTVTLTPLGGNGNAFLDPGESGSLSVQLINNSFAELTGINATLTSTSPASALRPPNLSTRTCHLTGSSQTPHRSPSTSPARRVGKF